MPNLIPFNRAQYAGGGSGTPGSDIVFTDDADFAASASPYIKPSTVYAFEFYAESYLGANTRINVDGDSNQSGTRSRTLTTNAQWTGGGYLALYKLTVGGSIISQNTTNTTPTNLPIGDGNTDKYAKGVIVTTGASDEGLLNQIELSVNNVIGVASYDVLCVVKELTTATLDTAHSYGAGKVIAVSRNNTVDSTGWYSFDNFEDVSDKVWIDQYWRYTVRMGVDTDPGATNYVGIDHSASGSASVTRKISTDFGAWSSGDAYSPGHTISVDAGTTVSTLSSGAYAVNMGNTGAVLLNRGWAFESDDKCGTLDPVDVVVTGVTGSGLSGVKAELLLAAANYLVGYTTAGIAMTSTGTKTFSDWVSAHTTAEVSAGSVHCRPYLEQGVDCHWTAFPISGSAIGQWQNLDNKNNTGSERYFKTDDGAWSTTADRAMTGDVRTRTKLSDMVIVTGNDGSFTVGHFTTGVKYGCGSTIGDVGTGPSMNGPLGYIGVFGTISRGPSAPLLDIEVRTGSTPATGDLIASATNFTSNNTVGLYHDDGDGWVGTQSVLMIAVTVPYGYTPHRSGSSISSTNATVTRVEVFTNLAAFYYGMPAETYANPSGVWSTFQASSDSGYRFEFWKVTFEPTVGGSPCSIDEFSVGTITTSDYPAVPTGYSLYGGNSGSYTKITETFDGTNWSSGADMLGYIRTAAAGVAYGGAAYSIGGTEYDGTSSLSNQKTTMAFDKTAWGSLDDMPSGRSSGAAATILGGINHVAGASSTYNNYRYDGTTWSEETAIPNPPRTNHGAAAIGDVMYVCNGFTTSGNQGLRDCDAWNGTSWSAKDNTPGSGRYGVAVSAYGSDIVTTGGFTGVRQATADSFDGTSWTSLTDFTGARYCHAAGELGSELLVCTGSSSGGTFGSVQSWNGASWSAENAVTTARVQPASAAI